MPYMLKHPVGLPKSAYPLAINSYEYYTMPDWKKEFYKKVEEPQKLPQVIKKKRSFKRALP